jgi:hypothetical protein
MDSIIFNINTRDIEIKKSTTNFIFNFDLYSFPKIKNVIEVRLLSIELPKTIYYFTNKRDNNNFTIVIDEVEYKFVLPEGNYSIEDLLSEIFEFLDTIDGGIFTYYFESKIKLLSITCNTNFSIYFKNTTNYTQLGKLLGFEQDEYIDVCSIQNNNKILVDTDKYFLFYLNGFGHLIYNNNNYFAKLVLQDQLTYINYINRGNIDKFYKFDQPVDLDKFEIKILDEIENEIDLNGLNVSLSLEIKFIKNNYLKLYYQNNIYDSELSKLMLHDNMLKYFYDKTKLVDFEPTENIIENIYSKPGAKLLHILSQHTYNFTESMVNNENSTSNKKLLDETKILSAEEKSKLRYMEEMKRKKIEKLKEKSKIKEIKNKFVY